MARSKNNQLYEKLVMMSEEYFGPGTDRFLATLLKNHLNKTPDQLSYSDIPNLINWLSLILSSINADPKKISNYTKRVKRLGKSNIND